MKRGLFERIFGFLGLGEEMEGDEMDFDPEYESNAVPYEARSRKKLVPLRSPKFAKLVVLEPKSFEDVQEVADNLKNRRPVILNVSNLEKEVAKRILDFTSGVIYALEGAMQKVGDGIFLFTPSNFEVAGDIDTGEEGGPVFFGR